MFTVHTPFPEDVAGKCIGNEQSGANTSRGRTLSAILASPRTLQASVRGPGKQKMNQTVDDKEMYERTYAEIDVEAIFAAAAAASQEAVSRRLQSQGIIGAKSPSPFCAKMSHVASPLRIREEDFDDGGNWIYDPPSGSGSMHSPTPSSSRRRIEMHSVAPEDAQWVGKWGNKY